MLINLRDCLKVLIYYKSYKQIYGYILKTTQHTFETESCVRIDGNQIFWYERGHSLHIFG